MTAPLTKEERLLLEDMTIQALAERGEEINDWNQHEFWGAPVSEPVLKDWVADLLDSVEEMLDVCGIASVEEFRREYVS